MKPLNHRFVNMALVGVLGGFVAASTMADPVTHSFKDADKNGDGKVSLVEFAAQGGTPKAFREGDSNNDRRLNSDEYLKAAANNDRIQAGNYVNDAWITAKVKSLLLKDKDVKGTAVNVETHKGIVQLSGWVSDPAQIAEAEKLAHSIEGVKDVRNDLQIKS